mgnify:CR=1 FL=1
MNTDEEADESVETDQPAEPMANRDYITSTDPKLNSLVALPNEVLCHVLGYWKAIMPALYDINPSFPRPSTA